VARRPRAEAPGLLGGPELRARPGAARSQTWWAYPTDGGAGPPGTRFRLDYEGFALYTWTRQSWKRFQRSALGELNRKGRCARTTEVELERGRAVIYADCGARHQGACPHHPPDRNWAIARISDMVIGVNLAICTLCLDSGEGPYNSLRGMKAIVRALEVRPKPTYDTESASSVAMRRLTRTR
jgi:hypothetical protein